MDLLRRLKDASSVHLERTRNNAAIYALRQHLGPYLKGDLANDQFQFQVTQGAKASLRKLELNPAALNHHLLGSGIEVKGCSIDSLELDLSSVRGVVSGICIVVALTPPTPRPASPLATPCAGSGNVEPSSSQVSGDSTEAPLGSIKVLTQCLQELLELLESYAEIAVNDVEVRVETPAKSKSLDGPRTASEDCDIDSKDAGADFLSNTGPPYLSLHFPSLSFRDSTLEHLDATSSAVSDTRKLISMQALSLRLRDAPLLQTESNISVEIRVSRTTSVQSSAWSVSIQVHNVDATVSENQLTDFAAINEAISGLRPDAESTSIDNLSCSIPSVNAVPVQDSEPASHTISLDVSSDNARTRPSASRVDQLVDTFMPTANEAERARWSSLYAKSLASMQGQEMTAAGGEDASEAESEFFDCEESDPPQSPPFIAADTPSVHLVTVDFTGTLAFAFVDASGQRVRLAATDARLTVSPPREKHASFSSTLKVTAQALALSARSQGSAESACIVRATAGETWATGGEALSVQLRIPDFSSSASLGDQCSSRVGVDGTMQHVHLALDLDAAAVAAGVARTLQRSLLQDGAPEGDLTAVDVSFRVVQLSLSTPVASSAPLPAAESTRWEKASHFMAANVLVADGPQALVVLGPIDANFSSGDSSLPQNVSADGSFEVEATHASVRLVDPSRGVTCRLLAAADLRLASHPLPASRKRHEDCERGDSSGNRIWEPRQDRDLAASTPELASLSTSSGGTAPRSQTLWSSASSIRLDLGREDLVLLGLLGLHLTEAAARFLANSQELPVAPPQNTSREASGGHAPQICVALDHLEAAMHCGALPLLKLAIDDTFIAVDSEFKAPFVVVRSASLAHCDADLGDWALLLGAAPRVRSKPAPGPNHNMLSLRLTPISCKVRLASALFRLPQSLNWITQVSEFCDISALESNHNDNSTAPPPPVAAAAAAPASAPAFSRLTVIATGSDLVVDLPPAARLRPAPLKATSAASQVVLDLEHVHFSTVFMSPRPPVQQYSASLNTVRLMCARSSPPYSAATESNFVELLSLPREKAVVAKVTVDSELGAVAVSVAVNEIVTSFCADSLATFQSHAAAIHPRDQAPSPAPESSPTPALTPPPPTGTRANPGKSVRKEGSAAGAAADDDDGDDDSDAMGKSLATLCIGEPLDLLPCIEDYFCQERQTSSGRSVASNGGDDDDGDGEVVTGERSSEEWVLDGFAATEPYGDTELEEWHPGMERKKQSVLEKFEAETEPVAAWYEGASVNRTIKPHHVRVPKKSSRLPSRIPDPSFDLEVSVASFNVRLFGGCDWIDDEQQDLPGGNPQCNPAAGAASVPTPPGDNEKAPAVVDLTSFSTSDNYFDDGQLSKSLPQQHQKQQQPMHSAKRRRHGRSPQMIEVAASHAQVRFTSRTSPSKGSNSPTAAAAAAGEASSSPQPSESSHLRVCLDLRVRQQLVGPAQNVVYEWRQWSQAHEELDPTTGAAVRMLEMDLWTRGGGSTLATVKLRPLRLCATWDLVDFARTFFAPMAATSEVALRADAGNGTPATKEATSSSGESAVLCLASGSSVEALRVKVDFDTRLVDLAAVQRGDNLELLKLFPLSGVEITLAAVRALEGTTPLDAFGNLVVQSWVRDLTSSQLVGFVAGVGPLRPFAHIGADAANVVLLPLRQYQVGGKPFFALRKGALAFAKTFTVESAQASSRLSRFVASSLSFLTEGQPSSNNTTRHASRGQPNGIGSGLALAHTSMSRGLTLAGHAIIAVPLEDYSKGGAKGALKSAVRAIPVAVLAPVIGATEALSYTLLGIRNSLNPGVKHDEDAKYAPP